jgi:nitrogen fixation/metabolism regulation signal transduction histidine kinase
MILLVTAMSVLIAILAYVRYENERKEYNRSRLIRKEDATKLHMTLEMDNEDYKVATANLPIILKNRIYDIAKVHSLDVAVYDLRGKLLISSVVSFEQNPELLQLPIQVLSDLKHSENKRLTSSEEIEDNRTIQYSYSYLEDAGSNPIAVLKLQYTQDNTDQEQDLKDFLFQLSGVFLIVLVIGVVLALLISSYITGPLKNLSITLAKTRLDKRNEKLEMGNKPSTEIKALVESYNAMVDELSDSATKLAKSEREQAWREMAKQVAHEIKNPLTPMKLTVQSFERRFNPEDADVKAKVKDFSASLVEQIDLMSSIASAFSDFAKMPSGKAERLNVAEVIRSTLEIFTESYIEAILEEEQLFANFDRNQLIRVITNLLTNALHAVEDNEHPRILVKLYRYKEEAFIEVVDNGVGIPESFQAMVFEPKFTTKTSGMGLGLPMIKNIIESYGGTISFVSKEGIGTTFTVKIPI